MSEWTYVNGTITVSAFGDTQAEMRYILETVVAHLPKVTGSEEDMYVHIIQMGGYDASCNYDELGEPMWLVDPKNKRVETQSNYMLVLEGHFRDRTFEETFQELNKFLNRLAKRTLVIDILVRLNGGGKSYLFDRKIPYLEMFENPSWAQDYLDSEPAWWEYLMFSRDPETKYPISLLRKYCEDPVNDAEWLRRQQYDRPWGKLHNKGVN